MKVGFIGLGVMGRGMALNILKVGHSLSVCDLDPARVKVLVDAGADDGGSPAGVADGAEVVVISAPDTSDVEAILFGVEGVANSAKSGSVVIDCSSISATASGVFAERLAESGVSLIDAPVSGGAKGAEDGTLSMMMGGDEAAIEKARPVLEAMGKTLSRIGPVGAGQVAKACNQLLIASTMMACAEMIALCRKMGLDPMVVREALMGGAAQSKVLEVHAKKMIDGAFEPGFRTRLMLKDLKLATGVGSDLGGFMPMANLVTQMMQSVFNSGRADFDHAASLGALMQEMWGNDEG